MDRGQAGDREPGADDNPVDRAAQADGSAEPIWSPDWWGTFGDRTAEPTPLGSRARWDPDAAGQFGHRVTSHGVTSSGWRLDGPRAVGGPAGFRLYTARNFQDRLDWTRAEARERGRLAWRAVRWWSLRWVRWPARRAARRIGAWWHQSAHRPVRDPQPPPGWSGRGFTIGTPDQWARYRRRTDWRRARWEIRGATRGTWTRLVRRARAWSVVASRCVTSRGRTESRGVTSPEERR